MVFPRQVDLQRYHAVALEVSLTHMVGALHLPGIVTDDVPISHWGALEDSSLISGDDPCTVEACPLKVRRW